MPGRAGVAAGKPILGRSGSVSLCGSVKGRAMEEDVGVVARKMLQGVVLRPPASVHRQPRLSGTDEAGDVAVDIPASEWFAVPSSGYWIVYEDARGDESERRIAVRKVRPSAPVALTAWCYEREAYRTFLIERMLEVAMLDTGEIIEDPRRHFLDLIGAGTLAQAIGGLRPLLDILSFIARADGDLALCEAEALADFVEWEWEGVPLDRAALMKIMRSLVPTAHSFTDAVSGIRLWPAARKRTLLRGVRSLVDADGVLAPEEADMVLRLMTEFGR